MAQLKIGAAPAKPVKEKREDALERLLLLAITLLPDDLDDDQDAAEELCGEACFWLDLQPRGAKVHATVPEKRLGYADVQARRAAYVLNDQGALVPVATPTATAPKGK